MCGSGLSATRQAGTQLHNQPPAALICSLFPKAILGCFWVQRRKLSFVCVSGDVALVLQASMQSSQVY